MHAVVVNENDRIELAKLVKLISDAEKPRTRLDQMHENGLTMEWLVNFYARIDASLKAPIPTPEAAAPSEAQPEKTEG